MGKPNDNNPSVSVVTLHMPGREKYLERVKTLLWRQDYEGEIHHVVVDGQRSIGAKRNIGMMYGVKSGAEYIFMIDDDDILTSDFIRLMVSFMRENPKVMMSGLSSMYFIDVNKRNRKGIPLFYEYKKGIKCQYVLGSGSVLRSSVYNTCRYPDVSSGEDAYMCQFVTKIYGECSVMANNITDSYAATIHGNNTSSHLALYSMSVLGYSDTAYKMFSEALVN